MTTSSLNLSRETFPDQTIILEDFLRICYATYMCSSQTSVASCLHRPLHRIDAFLDNRAHSSVTQYSENYVHESYEPGSISQRERAWCMDSHQFCVHSRRSAIIDWSELGPSIRPPGTFDQRWEMIEFYSRELRTEERKESDEAMSTSSSWFECVRQWLQYQLLFTEDSWTKGFSSTTETKECFGIVCFSNQNTYMIAGSSCWEKG